MKFVSMSGEQRGDGQHEGEAVERQERPDVAGGPGGEDLIGDLHIARPRHAWGAGVPLQQDGQRVDVVAGEEDIREPDEIEGDDRIVLPPQNIAQHQQLLQPRTQGLLYIQYKPLDNMPPLNEISVYVR